MKFGGGILELGHAPQRHTEFAELCFFYPIGRYRLDKIAHPFGTILDCSTSGFIHRTIYVKMLLVITKNFSLLVPP
jgi:hypothetical protein